MKKVNVKCNCGQQFVATFRDDNAAAGTVTCPACGSRLKVIVPQSKPPQPSVSSETKLPTGTFAQPGSLICGGREYPLSVGDNIVGRKAAGSSAHIQLEVNDPYMSRSHLLVRVVRAGDGSITTFVSNYKNMNTTLVNQRLLGKVDEVVVKDGDTIQLANTVVMFKNS